MGGLEFMPFPTRARIMAMVAPILAFKLKKEFTRKMYP